ncbi:hypothetical protein MPSEU_000499400 [Mayamaea pseudoterrestris]|nr:hypothetical protein MPSEU_000499400 [Mayamaea pseudoterrestris]
MAARTNLSSQSVTLHKNQIVGQGKFRIAYAGTYVGGNRNQQEAVCKRFRDNYGVLESEFFASAFKIADKAIEYAEDWNNMCEYGKKIMITRGDVMPIGGHKYLVEPLIRYFEKYTSNNGWIANEDDVGWVVLAMEAFSHYTYHRSGGQLIVCDMQGRYRYNKYSKAKCRFEVTDVAICSRRRSYGPTDLAEKGIESFFANHTCNRFCNFDKHWARPRSPTRWFAPNSQTSMLSSADTHLLNLGNRAKFQPNLQPIYDYDSDMDSDDSEDEYVPMRF